MVMFVKCIYLVLKINILSKLYRIISVKEVISINSDIGEF